MNILCLGVSYTGLYLAVNFVKHRVFFFSRRLNFIQQTLALLASNKLKFDMILDTVPCCYWADNNQAVPYYFQYIQELNITSRTPYIHLSSSSVYQSVCNGKVLTHTEQNFIYDKISRNAQNRRQLENTIREYYQKKLSLKVIIIRATGIYGPQRNIMTRFLDPKRQNIYNCSNRYVSRIHVHDLCRLILKLGQNTNIDIPMLHATDNHPTPQNEIIKFLAHKTKHTIDLKTKYVLPHGKKILSEYCPKILGEYIFPSIYAKGALDITSNYLSPVHEKSD